jgi:hypothetical protein
VPALTFRVSASFCFANSFAFSSLLNVSVPREKARFADRILFCSNETYQVSWGLTANGSSSRAMTQLHPFARRPQHVIVSHGRGARPGSARKHWHTSVGSTALITAASTETLRLYYAMEFLPEN